MILDINGSVRLLAVESFCHGLVIIVFVGIIVHFVFKSELVLPQRASGAISLYFLVEVHL